MIVIVDYGLGNVQSIANMVKQAGGAATISSRREDILAASHLILPGVGAFDHGMRNLQEQSILPSLSEAVLVAKTPILGICLGMQMMTLGSEEGNLAGLGWFDAFTRRFRFDDRGALKIPNMGWRSVMPWKRSGLFTAEGPRPRFYFVHSYHCVCSSRTDILATAHYGYEFCCGLQRDNIYGVQFHPEKSHSYGLSLIAGFLGSGRQARFAA